MSQNFKTISSYRNSEMNKMIISCPKLWTLKTKKGGEILHWGRHARKIKRATEVNKIKKNG